MSSGDLKLAFGLAEDGRMVSALAVARGKACNCVCPQCSSLLVAKQGDHKRWHFAHKADVSECVGAGETMVHRLAKQVIAQAGKITIPALVAYFEGGARRVVEKAQEIVLTDVRLETWLDGIRPDIFARCPDGTDLAIEIFVAHRVDAEKVEKIRARGFAAIEIDLSGFSGDLVTSGMFGEAVLREGSRDWLWHPQQAAADALFAAECITIRQYWAALEEARRDMATADQMVRQAAKDAQDLKRDFDRLAARSFEQQDKSREAYRQRVIAQAEEEVRREKAQRAIEAARAVAATESAERIAFIKSLPVVDVDSLSLPWCRCQTWTIWRVGEIHPWQCFTCDPPPRRAGFEIARATAVPGRAVWNDATRRWRGLTATPPPEYDEFADDEEAA